MQLKFLFWDVKSSNIENVYFQRQTIKGIELFIQNCSNCCYCLEIELLWRCSEHLVNRTEEKLLSFGWRVRVGLGLLGFSGELFEVCKHVMFCKYISF